MNGHRWKTPGMGIVKNQRVEIGHFSYGGEVTGRFIFAGAFHGKVNRTGEVLQRFYLFQIIEIHRPTSQRISDCIIETAVHTWNSCHNNQHLSVGNSFFHVVIFIYIEFVAFLVIIVCFCKKCNYRKG